MAAATLSAADTNAPPATVPAALTPEQMFEGGTDAYNNWIEFSTGEFFIGGSNAQFQQRHRTSGGAFGGIEDFHYQADLATNTTLTIDGRALFDEHDYKLSLGVAREKLGYLRFSYNEFRTWYNGDGGFYPPSGMWYPLSADALALDRGAISFEGGLTLENVPKITFKYTHTFRDGDKSSTSWGVTHPAIGVTRGLSPSFYDIDEHSDAFQLDAAHHIKATDFGVGLRYETGQLDNALKIDQGPGEPLEQKITDRQGTTYDLFNVHAFTETWIRKNLLFSSGYSFSDLDNNFSGSRIYGSDFDVSYVPSAQQTGFGYYGLTGGSRLHEYVMDLNLMWKPTPHFSIVPSLRVQREDADANSTGFETRGLNGLNPQIPFNGRSDAGEFDLRERLDLSYNGITNWVFHARGEWTEGDGNLTENGGLGPVSGNTEFQPIQRQTDDSRFFQKYSAGARWYPARRVTLDAGGYYKINEYSYSHKFDDTLNNSGNRYPAYLVMRDFETYDGNLRLTLRPWQNVTLVSRYEYQLSTIHTKPDPISVLSEVESSKMTSHIVAQDVSWSPWSRLCLQAGFNYVLSDTRTPASDYTQAILNAQNNYWTLNFSSGLVLDDKTDLNLRYFYYRADDYSNNSSVGVPYGTGAEEHGITATMMRRLAKNLRLTLKYGFFHYDDETSGGNNNYQAHLVYSSLQYRF
ncbi:MAG: hypothetical protein AAB676_14325 [Verrucomicrobiota bacterium]